TISKSKYFIIFKIYLFNLLNQSFNPYSYPYPYIYYYSKARNRFCTKYKLLSCSNTMNGVPLESEFHGGLVNRNLHFCFSL
ncbi:unnamed protein product, partial [Nezara viridula]